MGSRRALVELHQAEITEVAQRHRVLTIAVFGSAARGDDDDRSDVDFLVEFEAGSSLFDLLHLQDELESILGCSVDVLSAGGLKERDDHIRREAIPI